MPLPTLSMPRRSAVVFEFRKVNWAWAVAVIATESKDQGQAHGDQCGVAVRWWATGHSSQVSKSRPGAPGCVMGWASAN